MPEHDQPSDHPEHSGEEEHIHLPPNSIVPLCTAASMTLTFAGLLIPVKPRIGPVIIPVIAVLGVVLLVACGLAWLRTARREYQDLPE